MGWAQRAREAATIDRTEFVVRIWTDFKWQYPKGEMASTKKANKQQLEGFAAKLGVKLRQVGGDRCRVLLVSVNRHPQLLFELPVVAPNKEAAVVTARMRLKKTLTVPLTPNRNPPRFTGQARPGLLIKAYRQQQRTLNPPLGKVEVEAA